MGINSEVFFENNLFRYENYSCDSVKDIIHTSPGVEPVTTIKLQSLPDKNIRFAYAAKEGLLRLANTGAVDEENILASLISLPNKDLDALFDFFKKNGFLFPVKDDEYESVDGHVMLELINRIKATVRLMSAIEETRKNYKDILHLTIYLLLSDPVSIKLDSLETPHISCQHPFYKELQNISYLQTVDRRQENFEKDSYTIKDTIYFPSYELDINVYNNITSGYGSSTPGYNDARFKEIVNLYCNHQNAEISIRLIIDFLFHYQFNVGVISTFDYENGIQYYAEPDNSKFSKHLKDALIDIARIVLGEEINSNLGGIHPKYNVESMSPSWNVDSLMSAIYFSVFYMQPSLELFRQCANISCNQYFKVKTTSTRNKYCSPECGNAMSQRNYRKRQKEKRQ